MLWNEECYGIECEVTGVWGDEGGEVRHEVSGGVEYEVWSVCERCDEGWRLVRYGVWEVTGMWGDEGWWWESGELDVSVVEYEYGVWEVSDDGWRLVGWGKELRGRLVLRGEWDDRLVVWCEVMRVEVWWVGWEKVRGMGYGMGEREYIGI
jgi:hypothetical protein